MSASYSGVGLASAKSVTIRYAIAGATTPGSAAVDLELLDLAAGHLGGSG